MGGLNFSDIYVRNLKVELGVRYEYFDFNSFLYAQPGEREKVKPEGFLSYYGLMHYETYDQKYYPEKDINIRKIQSPHVIGKSDIISFPPPVV